MNTTLKIGLAILSVTSLACSSGKTEKSAPQDAASEKIEVVRVTELQVQQVARSVEYSSTLLAYEEIHMAPASPGRIDQIAVEVGTRVSKGDLLVQMDRTQLHKPNLRHGPMKPI